MKATSWRDEAETVLFFYKVQFNDILPKENKSVRAIIDGWNIIGEGWKSDGTTIIIARKQFKSKYDWESWAKKAPFELEELKSRANKEKRICHSKGRPAH